MKPEFRILLFRRLLALTGTVKTNGLLQGFLTSVSLRSETQMPTELICHLFPRPVAAPTARSNSSTGELDVYSHSTRWVVAQVFGVKILWQYKIYLSTHKTGLGASQGSL